MLPIDWFNKHRGEAISVDGLKENFGQCEQAADSYLHDVYNLPYIYTPAALDWWTKFDNFPQLRDNFVRIYPGNPVKAGDFVIYNTGIGSVYGHVDMCSRDGTYLDFMAYDSNWGGKAFFNPQGYPVLHEVHHADIYNSYIVGYLRRKGEEDEPMFNEGDRVNVNNSLYGSDKGYHKEFVDNKTYKQALEAIFGSPEFRAEQYFNAGDDVNLATTSGWPQEPALIGWLHKRVIYDYIFNKIRK